MLRHCPLPKSAVFYCLIVALLMSFAIRVAAQEEVQMEPAIQVNQVGYYPDRAKIAAFHHESATPLPWQLQDAAGQIVTSGESIVHGRDNASRQNVHHIVFTEINQLGNSYTLTVENLTSPPFDIRADLYSQLPTDALRYFYLNRSGLELLPEHAGAWARPAGHLSDSNVTCFAGQDISGQAWPACDYTLDASGGWYDAGDYGKYVVNGGIALWTMLNQYERNPAAFADGTLNIPESGNGVPDILDEARWQMNFLLGMQVPEGQALAGMAHHKLHDLVWDPLPSLPVTERDNDNEHQREGQGRYVYHPSTAATLNLAATAAQCARIWVEIDPPFAAQCLQAAERAWEAAVANPALFAGNVPGSGGGAYDDRNVTDEFYWAAAELFVTTGEEPYRDFLTASPRFLQLPAGGGAMSWSDTAVLGTITLAVVPNQLPPEQIAQAQANIISTADWYLALMAQQGYRMPLLNFVWGSNSVLLNNLIIMGLAYDFSGDSRYLDGVTEGMDYLLGRNPLGQSYVSGYGTQPMAYPHHRVWVNDPAQGWPPPPPGAVAGGPNDSPSDPAATEAGLSRRAPALRYVDDVGSYSTNEVAINWNAPLAWGAAFLDEQYRPVAPATPEPAPTTAVSVWPWVLITLGLIAIAALLLKSTIFCSGHESVTYFF